MFLRFLSACLFLLSGQLALAQPAPTDSVVLPGRQRVDLEGGASIELPAEVSASVSEDMHLRTVNSESVVYVVVVKQLSAATELAFVADPDALYDNVIKGSLNDSTQDRLVRRTPFKIGEQAGLEIELDLPSEPRMARARYLRTIAAGGWLYLYSWRELAGQPANQAAAVADRARFFNSFQLKKEAAPAPAPPDDARASGRQAGRYLFYLALAGGLFWLLRRRRQTGG